MSSVQSIRRAFAVLGALARRALGVTEVAERSGLPKSTAARMLATLVDEGAVEQVPGDTALPAGTAARDAGRRAHARPIAGGRRPTDAGRAGRRVRRGGRPVRPRRRPRPLHRPGRHAEPGLGPRLDRDAGCRSTRSRPGRCCWPSGRRRPSSAIWRGRWSGSRRGPSSTPRRCASGCARSGGTGYAWVRRGVRRGDRVRGGADRRRVRARSSRRSTCTGRRTGSRPTGRTRRSPRRVVGAAARIAGSLRRT